MTSLQKELSLQSCQESESSRKPLIIADNLGIKFDSDKKASDDFKSHAHDYVSSFFSKDSKVKREPFWALQGVSFEAYPGDVLGIIGSNGAGKTTLCRAILGMLRPNTGSLQVKGDISSLLSLGAGFNRELSGRDNIYLNGMMLGLTRKRICELTPAIEEFAGIDPRFRNMPIKYYSSGMKARLGFSIASSIEAEILVIDEVLGAGDLSFQEKAASRMRELVSASKMILVVTHNTSFVEKHCNRVIWFDEGRLVAAGQPADIVPRYLEFMAGKSKPVKRKLISLCETSTESGTHNTIEVNGLGVCFKVEKAPFWALKDVSFTVQDKEIVGIIGPNGAGKSTLCRILCDLYRADEGSVSVNGRVTALLSFRAGFNEQLNGIDNIYLNGMMLGMPMKDISGFEEDIIRFAELEKFIRKPVKYYSSGMKSRLGFCIAAMLNPDILIIDEALSAGDIAFQEKAAQRMQELIREAKSVIIVSHNMKVIEKICTRTIWLQQGRIKFDGESKAAVALYQEWAEKKKKQQKQTK